MKIQILSVEVKTVPTAKGSYQQADIAFKNLTYQGKVEGKKLMSFGAGAATFKELTAAQPSAIYDITVVKNAAGFNDWTQAVPSTADSAEAQVYQPSTPGAKPTATTATRSTYETPEERAAKQVYIIRQSTLSNAINCLSVGGKSPPKVDDVLALAKAFEDHVFGKVAQMDDFSDMADDIPE